jgi:hypothetical protein
MLSSCTPIPAFRIYDRRRGCTARPDPKHLSACACSFDVAAIKPARAAKFHTEILQTLDTLTITTIHN